MQLIDLVGVRISSVRVRVWEFLLEQNNRKASFTVEVLAVDVTIFSLNGMTNPYNRHAWSFQNPHPIDHFQHCFCWNVLVTIA